MPNFTLTESKILFVLSDGQRHTKAELQTVLAHELVDENAIRVHVCNIRKKLDAVGEDIRLKIVDGVTYWQHVRIVSIN